MRKKHKRIRKCLSMVLGFIMIIALFPVNVLADSAEPFDTEVVNMELDEEETELSADPSDPDGEEKEADPSADLSDMDGEEEDTELSADLSDQAEDPELSTDLSDPDGKEEETEPSADPSELGEAEEEMDPSVYPAEPDSPAPEKDVPDPTETEETVTPLEEEESSSVAETPEAETVLFSAGSLSHKGTDYSVKVTYGPEARIPEGSSLKVFEIKEGSPEYSLYFASAAAAVKGNGEVSVAARFFDISIIDKEEHEVSPASDVSVAIYYETPENVPEGDAADVVHFDDQTGGLELMPVDASSDDMVQFNTDGFSVYGVIYTVEFHFGSYSWTIDGGQSVRLSELLAKLGITSDSNVSIADVEQVLFSDSSLISIQKTNDGDWMLESLKPFDTQETLTLVLKNGIRLDIAVTDDNNRNGGVPESTELVNFLQDVVIYGASLNGEGQYVIVEGEEYNIVLSFAEGSTYQFDNYEPLTYTMPDGLKVLREQTGSLTINIVYRNDTYQVGGSFDLKEDGTLTIEFDHEDPDFPILLVATNVSFRFSYYACFTDDEFPIEYSDTIEKDIIFDEPEPGKAYAEKTASYDETTGVFTYTVTVTADGDVQNVNVKDSIIGNALIFNKNSITVNPEGLSYEDNEAENGFDYTFASMTDGQTITITYTASVDFSMDEDNDGKITADQTKNTLTVDPDPGDPHHSEYSREITYKSITKSNGTEAGDINIDGKEYRILNWTINYNPLALVAVGGDVIKDVISTESASSAASLAKWATTPSLITLSRR